MSNNFPFQAADIIRARLPQGFKPRVAMILGSGLGVLAEQMTDAITIGYEELPGFPISTVHGHAGELVIGTLSGVQVVCMKGRGHVYEGYGLGVMTSAVRTMKLLGCEMLFVTNAAGSLRTEVDAGALVALVAEAAQGVIVMVGCGRSFQPMPRALRQELAAAGVHAEWMDTGAACRTFNLLVSEGREVRAALLAVE